MTLFPELIAIFCDSLTHIQCKWLGFGCFCIFSSLSRDRLGSFDWCIVGYYMRLLAFICFALYTVGDWWMRISHTQHFFESMRTFKLNIRDDVYAQQICDYRWNQDRHTQKKNVQPFYSASNAVIFVQAQNLKFLNEVGFAMAPNIWNQLESAWFQLFSTMIKNLLQINISVKIDELIWLAIEMNSN